MNSDGLPPRVPSILASLAMVLSVATPCYAHSVHPLFWWLGPLAPVLVLCLVVGCSPLLAAMVGQAFLLHRFIGGMTFLGSLWRAVVIFIVSKVAETLPAFIDTNIFMGPCSETALASIVTLMLVTAVGANAALIGILYRRARPNASRIAWLSVALQGISCVGWYLSVTILAFSGIIR